MSQFSEHPAFYNRPIWLSEEQKNNPHGVLVSFFYDYHLIDLREFLSEVSEICLTSDEHPFDEAIKRANLICYHRRFEILLEAAFLVAQLNRDKDPD